MARLNPSGLTSRRPFTLLGILLALLVIAAFVLVAINASAGQGTSMQSVVIATKDLSPRVPIDAAALDIKSVPIAGMYGIRGCGLYEEEYVRTPAGWRISFSRLVRTRIDPLTGTPAPAPYTYPAPDNAWLDE